MSNSRVPVYAEERHGTVIARVQYNDNLDYWDGHNWTCGSTGRHEGLARLRDGRYVLIHGTQWQGDRDWAEVISAKEAVSLIVSRGCQSLLDQPRFKDLRALVTDLDAAEMPL